MNELVFPGDITDLVDPNVGEQFSPALQEAVEKQFGFVPEFHRLYASDFQCRVMQYAPEQGYIRFQSVTSSRGDAMAWMFFPIAGSVTEYQLLDATTRDLVSRHAFFTKDWEGKMELGEADVFYRQGNLDTEYRIDYDDEGATPSHISVKIFSNHAKDRAGFSYTELIQAYRHQDEPWEVCVAHGTFEELDVYYQDQKRQYDLVGYGFRNYFPGILLELPQAGLDVLVYDGLQGLSLATEKPKQIDLMQLGKPKIIYERGAYLYLVTAGSVVFISRAGQDDSDRKTWEVTLFNDDNRALDTAIKSDWVNLKGTLAAELIVK